MEPFIVVTTVHTKTEPRERKASRTRAGRIAAKQRPDSVTAKAALTSFSYTAPALLLTAPGEDPFLFYCLASEEGISQVRMLFCCSNQINLLGKGLWFGYSSISKE